MSERAEWTPELSEVQQVDDTESFDLRDVPVSISGPVRVQRLPSRVTVMRSVPLADVAQSIAGRDDRRSRVTLLATAETASTFVVGTTAAAVAGESAVVWPTGVPLVLEHAEQIWAKARASETVTLSFTIEQWAD